MKEKKVELELDQKEEKALLTFLKRTRDGKYAKIAESSLSYVRIFIYREPVCEDEYYYSYR